MLLAAAILGGLTIIGELSRSSGKVCSVPEGAAWNVLLDEARSGKLGAGWNELVKYA